MERTGAPTTLNCSLNHARCADHQLLGLNSSTGWFNLAAPRPHCGSRRFSSPFTGRSATSTVAEIVQCGEPFHQKLTAIESVNNFARLSIRLEPDANR